MMPASVSRRSLPLYREARPASFAWNIFKALGYEALMVACFLIVISHFLFIVEEKMGWSRFRFASPALEVTGVIIFFFFSLLCLGSNVAMAVRGEGTPLPTDCAGRLVIAGPYRYVRNPMGMGGLIRGAAVGIYLGSPLVLAYVLAGLVVLEMVIRPGEEKDLTQRFGDEYERYRRHVRCWVPRLRPYQPGAG